MRAKRVLRAARPTFTRHGSHRKKEVKANWRKPRGLHNKQRDNKKNRAPRPDMGWRTPVELRGVHISGLSIVRVQNPAQLAGIDAKTCGVVVAAVGAKKQLAIIDACAKIGVRVLNFKADERKQSLTAAYQARVKAREDAREAKKESEKKKEKAAKDKKSVEETLTEDEKKAEQDKIKEEVLTDKHQ